MLLKNVDDNVFDMFITTIITFVDGLLEAHSDTKNIAVVLIKEVRQFQKTIAYGQKLLDELIK
jgi:alanyl-tRNA synthetase